MPAHALRPPRMRRSMLGMGPAAWPAARRAAARSHPPPRVRRAPKPAGPRAAVCALHPRGLHGASGPHRDRPARQARCGGGPQVRPFPRAIGGCRRALRGAGWVRAVGACFLGPPPTSIRYVGLLPNQSSSHRTPPTHQTSRPQQHRGHARGDAAAQAQRDCHHLPLGLHRHALHRARGGRGGRGRGAGADDQGARPVRAPPARPSRACGLRGA